MKPLAGIRVVDFTDIWAGPWTSRMLLELGAHVIKIEGPRQVVRAAPGALRRALIASDELDDQGRPVYFRNAYQTMTNQGKLHVTLDLKEPDGAALFKDLAAISDVVVENYAPHVMQSLGLDYEDLKSVKPDLIMLRTSAMGQTGPERAYTGLGATAEMLSGISTITGYEDGEPQKSGLNYADPFAGVHGAFAVMAALVQRDRTGEGMLIDMSLRESLVATLGEYIVGQSMNGTQPPRMGNRVPETAPHNVYRCREDDTWVFIEARTNEEFAALCRVIGRSDLAEDARFADVPSRKTNEDELDEAIEAWTAGHTNHDAMKVLQESGVPAGAVLNVEETVNDPHHVENEAFRWVDHPNGKSYPIPQLPWKVPSAPRRDRPAAPPIGQDNREVWEDLCGMPFERVDALEEAGVVLL